MARNFKALECLHCEQPASSYGCCIKHYGRFDVIVRRGETTWDQLREQGKVIARRGPNAGMDYNIQRKYTEPVSEPLVMTEEALDTKTDPNVYTCLESGCGLNAVIRGLCKDHWHYWRRRILERLTSWQVLEAIGRSRPWRAGEWVEVTEKPGGPVKKPIAERALCLHCNTHSSSRGVCGKHWSQLRRQIELGLTTMKKLEKQGKILPAQRKKRGAKKR